MKEPKFKCPWCDSDIIISVTVVTARSTVEVRITADGSIEEDMSTVSDPDEELSGYFACGGCEEDLIDHHGDVFLSSQDLITYLTSQKRQNNETA